MKTGLFVAAALTGAAMTSTAATYATSDFSQWNAATTGGGVSASVSNEIGLSSPSLLVTVAGNATGTAYTSPKFEHSGYMLEGAAFRVSFDVISIEALGVTGQDVSLAIAVSGGLLAIPLTSVSHTEDWQRMSFSGVIRADAVQLLQGSWNGVFGYDGSSKRFGLAFSATQGSDGSVFAYDNISITVVPEPMPTTMLLAGLLAIHAATRKKGMHS